jgi:serine/threonine protein kinase
MSRVAAGLSPDNEVSRPDLGADPLARERPIHWVGKYRILSELGRGGMSNVYLAVARGPGGVNKLIVLKAVLPELASEPGALSMFLDEARLAAQLNHPNVVQTYEVGTEGDRHVIVMEYLEGQSLAEIVRSAEKAGQKLPLSMYIRILINALEGLQYAHELAAYDGTPLLLVHRDVSPQNIFVTYRGAVKVLDFGIAKASSSSTHTATGVVKGKIAYMAPEQMVADTLDRRADLYSVGCILWSAATGRKLWKDAPDVHIMRRVINGDVPTPQSVNQAVDDELNRIVMKSLATDPDKRYDTAASMQEDLERYLERMDPVKPKDIGTFVSNLFSSTRAEIKALVEHQLSRAFEDGTNSADFSARSEVRPTAIPGTASGISNGSISSGSNRSISNGTLQAMSGASAQNMSLVADAFGDAPPRKRGWALPLTLLALLGAGVAFWQLRGNHEVVPPTAAKTAADQAKPAETAPQTATIRFKVDPPEAEVFLDDQKLPSNPTSKVLAIDGKVYKLRAVAPGHLESVSEFSPMRDEAVEMTLQKIAPEQAPTSEAQKPRGKVRWVAPAPVAAAPAPVASPAKPSKPASCAQPFYVDSDGIKKARPECL